MLKLGLPPVGGSGGSSIDGVPIGVGKSFQKLQESIEFVLNAIDVQGSMPQPLRDLI